MLRRVLGEHAVQSGSLVDADRLRFDFAHFAALTDDERNRIEQGVLALAVADSDLTCREMSLREARDMGATALFGEKYGERVRVVQIGDFSKELCGGTHLPHASAVGGFAILSESSIGAGLRRIEAVTGLKARALAQRQRELIADAARLLKCQPSLAILTAIQALQNRLESANRALIERIMDGIESESVRLAALAVEVNGVNVVAGKASGEFSEVLGRIADHVRNLLGSGIVVLGCDSEGHAHFAATVSNDLVEAGYHAGNLIREVAKIAGGGGGGRPDFAQAGGKNPERLDEALAKVSELVAAQKG